MKYLQTCYSTLQLTLTITVLSSNIATVSAGTRVISVTVDVPSAWTAPNNTGTYVEVGDDNKCVHAFIRAQDVDVLKASQYHSQYQYEYSVRSCIIFGYYSRNSHQQEQVQLVLY